MLQQLRDKAQGWAAWVVIGIIALSFILIGSDALFTSGRGDQQLLAKINGTKITARQVDQVYQRYLNQPGAEAMRSLDPVGVKKDLLESMIEEAIVLRAAHKLGMRVNQQRILSTITSIPLFQEGGHFSEQAYVRFLNNADYTDQSFQYLLRDNLLREQLHRGITQSAFSLDDEVKNLVHYLLQKRDVRYIKVPYQSFVSDIRIDDSAIQAYYDSHLSDYRTKEKVKLEYIVLSLRDRAKEYQPSDEELTLFYEENQGHYTTPERIKVAHILINALGTDKDALTKAKQKIHDLKARIDKGEDFAALAKEHSDDTNSAENGGALDWFERSEMVPEFEEAAFSLKTKGKLSGPVQTQFGYHLIQLIDKQDKKVQSFSEVKADIQKKLKEQYASEQFIHLADEMTALAFEHPSTLQPVSEKLDLPILKSTPFTQSDGPTEKHLQHQKVISAAFSRELKEDENNSDLIKLDEENYVVFRVSKFTPSKQLSLADVKSKVKAHLVQVEAKAKAKAKTVSMLETMKQEKNAQALAKSFGWQEAKGLTRSSSQVSGDIIAGAFSMPGLKNEQSPELTSLALENGDFAIIWLTQIKDGEYNALSREEKENYEKALTKHRGDLEYELYTKDQMHRVKVNKYLDRV